MMKRKSIGIINTFLALMIVALLCVPSALVYAYTTTGIKLNTDYTLTFVPYSGFEATSISHFNEALYQWNSAAGIGSSTSYSGNNQNHSHFAGGFDYYHTITKNDFEQ